MISADMKWNILLLFSAICAAFSFSSGFAKTVMQVPILYTITDFLVSIHQLNISLVSQVGTAELSQWQIHNSVVYTARAC